MEKYNGIIFAGHLERDNVMCELEKVPKKSLMKLGDKYFIERIAEEFVKCEEIGDIYICGMNEEEWKTDLPVIFNDDPSSIFRKVVNVYDKFITKKENYSEIAVIFGADGPLIKAEIISEYIKSCKEASGGEIDGIFYYGVVNRETMEKKFPNSNRTYATFKGEELCGGDLTVVNIKRMLDKEKLIDDLFENRKSVIAQLIVLNPLFMIRFLLKRLPLDKFMKSMNKKVFKVERGVYAVPSDDAETAMDVDKPHQLVEVRRYYEENKHLYD